MNFPRAEHDLSALDLENLAPRPFDVYDDDQFADMVPAASREIQDLLLTLRQIEMADGIGALNAEKALKDLRGDARAIRERLAEEWGERW